MVKYPLNFDDDGVERVDVENISASCACDVFLEQTDNSLPQASIMKSARGDKSPCKVLFMELQSNSIPR